MGIDSDYWNTFLGEDLYRDRRWVGESIRVKLCVLFSMFSVWSGLIQTFVSFFIIGSSRLTHPIFLRLQYSGDTFSTLPLIDRLILVSNILLCRSSSSSSALSAE